MMKLSGVLLLLGILTIAFAREHKKGGDDDRGHKKEGFDWKHALRDEGFSEEEIAGFEAEARAAAIFLIIAAGGDEEYVSWSEARGYEECEEFMYRGKGKGREARSTHKGKPYHKGGKKTHKPLSTAEICKENECPKYEEPEPTGCGFGVRNILAAKWASTDLDITDIEGSFLAALYRLHKYISGANDQGASIGHTVPLIIRWYGLYHETDDSFELRGASMLKYISAEFQENTPSPTDEAVYIREWSDTLVYYRAFGGDSMGTEIYKREFGNLANALQNEEVDFYESIAITGEFTTPVHDRQRHEVMFIGR